MIVGVQTSSRSAGGATTALAGMCCYCRGGEGVEKAGLMCFEEKDWCRVEMTD